MLWNDTVLQYSMLFAHFKNDIFCIWKKNNWIHVSHPSTSWLSVQSLPGYPPWLGMKWQLLSCKQRRKKYWSLPLLELSLYFPSRTLKLNSGWQIFSELLLFPSHYLRHHPRHQWGNRKKDGWKLVSVLDISISLLQGSIWSITWESYTGIQEFRGGIRCFHPGNQEKCMVELLLELGRERWEGFLQPVSGRAFQTEGAAQANAWRQGHTEHTQGRPHGFIRLDGVCVSWILQGEARNGVWRVLKAVVRDLDLDLRGSRSVEVGTTFLSTYF